MSRKPTGKPPGRPKTRHTEEATVGRLHTAMLYYMLRAENHKPDVGYKALGGRSRVLDACAEFKSDKEVLKIRRERLSRAAWRTYMERLVARCQVASDLETYWRVDGLLRAIGKAMAAKSRGSVLGGTWKPVA